MSSEDEERERRHRESRARQERRQRERDGFRTAQVRYNENTFPFWLEAAGLITLEETEDAECVAEAIEDILLTLQAEGVFVDYGVPKPTHYNPVGPRERQTYKPKRQDRPKSSDRKLGWAWRPGRKPREPEDAWKLEPKMSASDKTKSKKNKDL